MIAPALPSEPPPPSVRRRLAALAYESLLLFGVVFFAGLTFGVALQQRNGLDHRNLLAGWIALVVGAYFVWFWTHGGQTLPMKTWRLRVETARGAPLSAGRALARYALGWLWFLPPSRCTRSPASRCPARSPRRPSGSRCGRSPRACIRAASSRTTASPAPASSTRPAAADSP
ncbi:unnamed protein product [Burkholderia pseudomallei]|nr:unnamed protein product [Burkholderia pseudomallei]